MTPIALYPSDASLKKGGALGVFLLFIGYQYLTWSPNGEPIIPAMFALGGLGLIGLCVWRYFKPRPSFEADANGFSVMGKKRRSWDEYRGARIYTMRVGFIPAARWVIVKTGKTILGGKVHIKWTHLSSNAADMAAEIEAYARIAKLMAEGHAAGAMAPQAQATNSGSIHRPQGAPTPSPRPAERPYTVAAQAAGSSPVQSVPSFGERLFGNRKVM